MKSRLLLILVIAVFAQAKTMAADTMSPQVFRDTVIVQSDSVSHHHRCVIKSLEERSIVLWVVDGVIYDNIVVDAEDISEPAQVLIEKV